ncbi:SMI1/KNR4 family protein [Deinococcus sp.]|uniref:SMI1/KNR4 family protein n=1 Tax=Deinococcus sp. TaxID=47478 RepID=UPI003C7AB393
MSVSQSWQQLKEVFFRLNPEAPRLFRAGATRGERSRLQQFFPELPESIYQLLGTNNGEERRSYGEMMFGFRLLDIDGMLHIQEAWNQIADEQDGDENNEIEGVVFPEDAGKADYFSRQYLVFADNGAGDSLVMDLAPGAKGTPGQVTHVGKYVIDRYVIADGLESFFDLLASLHLDPRLKMNWAEGRISEATWDGDRNTMVTGLFTLLPLLYEEGRLYQAK